MYMLLVFTWTAQAADWLSYGFMAKSAHWGHVEHGQFT